MDNVVDTLKIEAEGDVGKAESGLNRLISVLEKFKSVTSGTNKGLSKTSKALDAIDAVMAKIESGSIGKLRALSNGIKSLTGLDKIKLSAKLPEQLTNIGAAVDCLRDVDFSKLNEMAAGLAALKDAGGGQLPNLGGAGTNVSGGASAQMVEIQTAAEKATASVRNLNAEISTPAVDTEAALQMVEIKSAAENATNSVSGLEDAIRCANEATSFVRTKSDLDVINMKLSAAYAKLTQFLEEGDTDSSAVASLVAQIKRLETASEKATASSHMAELQAATESATASVRDLNAEISTPVSDTGISSQMVEIQAAAEKATAPVKGLASEIDKASDSTSNLTKNIKNTGKAAKAAIPRLGGLFSSIVRIAKYRFIRFVLKEITQGFKEGMDACYQYSKIINGDFARSMDSIATSFKYLKNSLGAMISPLLIALAPLIEIAVDKFVDLLNIINQVFSRLSGSSTWTRAVRYPIEYAEAADAATEANRKLKNSILGMDEINPLTDNSYSASGNAGNSNNYGLQFVTEQIDTTMVDALIDKLKVVAKVAAIVAGVFLTWKLAKGFISGITALLSLFGIASPGGAFTVPSVGTTLKGLADLGLIVLGVIGLIEILGLLTKIPGFESTARDGISLLGIAFKGI